MFSQANEVGCTLLLNVNNELRDVAKGSIVMPTSRVFHGNEMPPHVYRVRVDRPFPGCEDLHPPYQPPMADSELKLGGLKNYMCLWPKTLIRLNTTSVSAASQGKVTPPVVVSAFGPGADDDQHEASAPIDDFIAELDHNYQAPHVDYQREEETSAGPKAAQTLKKNLFGSQNTPEDAAFTATQQPTFVSPNTLLGAARSAMIDTGTPACLKKKKQRKRPNKKASDANASSSQQAPPVRVLDKLPSKWRQVHWLGQPMLPPDELAQMTGDLRSMHDHILRLENDLLSMSSPTYPVHVVKVPCGMGFMDTYPTEVMFIRFSDIFNVYNMKQLHRTLVRLVALSMAHDIITERTPEVVIMDPFYMMESVMSNRGDRLIATKVITEFLVENKEKKVFLIPYFPE